MLLPIGGEVKKVKDKDLEKKWQDEIDAYLNKINYLGKDIVKATDEIRRCHYEIQMRGHFLGEANTVIEEGHGPYV
jgi:hypothetical protein